MKKQTTIWFVQAWPFIAITVVALFHYYVISYFQEDTGEYINKLFSALMQIIGGLIVLFTINSNLGLFENKGLVSMAISWFRSCPLIKTTKPNIGTMYGELPTLKMSAEGHTTSKYENIDEQLQELHKQLNEVRDLVYRKERELKSYIHDQATELKKNISGNQLEIYKVKGLMHRTIVGGIQWQLFGVFLVIYGAVFPLV
jgi:hypothetical protein